MSNKTTHTLSNDLSDLHQTNWRNGISSELRFWRPWLADKGGRGFGADYKARMNPDTPLAAAIDIFLQPSSRTASILDVGSGPITNIGYCSKKCPVQITATDPLADEYAALLAEFDVKPPVPTIRVAAEELSQHFSPCTFDVVHSRNALDHSYDPLEAIRQMLLVCKPGGVVLITVYRNEGLTANYDGLHQWNFDEHQGRLLVYSRKAARYLDEFIDQPYDFVIRFSCSDPFLAKAARPFVTLTIKKKPCDNE
jgi:SAM-dependent methyltransferase